MGSKWVKRGRSQTYYSEIGSFTLVHWDELILDELGNKLDKIVDVTSNQWNDLDVDATLAKFTTKDKSIWSIIDLKVTEKRKGFGTRLVKAAIRRAKKMKITKLGVIPEPTVEACEFWKTFGVPAKGSYLTID